MKKKIVIVDEGKPIAERLQFHFQKEGFSIACAKSRGKYRGDRY